MSKNINIKTEGVTNVKYGNHSDDEPTFDSRTAAVTRDEKDWNAFQLFGDTNAEEMNHISHPQVKGEALEKTLDRARALRLGMKLRMVMEAQEAA